MTCVCLYILFSVSSLSRIGWWLWWLYTFFSSPHPHVGSACFLLFRDKQIFSLIFFLYIQSKISIGRGTFAVSFGEKKKKKTFLLFFSEKKLQTFCFFLSPRQKSCRDRTKRVFYRREKREKSKILL